jgi:hypothetical protein
MKPAIRHRRGETCPPSFFIEAAAAGEDIPAPHREHLAQCGHCIEYREALSAASTAFVRARPANDVLRALRAKEPSRRDESRAPWTRWLFLAPVALAAALAVALWPHAAEHAVSGEPETIRLKGGPLQLFVMREGASEGRPWSPGEMLAEGDALRFAYPSGREGYLVILDKPAAQPPSAFFPYGANEPARVEGGDALLPGAVTLDGSQGPEWLVAVFSDRPFSVDALVAQLRAQDASKPPSLQCEGCATTVVRIR